MAVQLIQEMVEIPKECNDVRVMIVALVKDIAAKKSIADITADVLPKLVDAIDGFTAMADEVKDAHIYKLAALMIGDVVEAFLVKPAAPAQAPATPAPQAPAAQA